MMREPFQPGAAGSDLQARLAESMSAVALGVRRLLALRAERDYLLGLGLPDYLGSLSADERQAVLFGVELAKTRQGTLAEIAEITREIDEESAALGCMETRARYARTAFEVELVFPVVVAP